LELRKEDKKIREENTQNSRLDLTNPLARLCAFAQTAPSPAGTDLQVKRMFGCLRQKKEEKKIQER